MANAKVQYRGFLMLAGKHVAGDNIQNGHLFNATLEIIAREQTSVEVSLKSCCGHFHLKPDFNVQDSGVFIYIILDGESRPRIRKWGRSDFRFFDNESDFRMALSRYHDNQAGSSVCARCVGVFYGNDDIPAW